MTTDVKAVLAGIRERLEFPLCAPGRFFTCEDARAQNVAIGHARTDVPRLLAALDAVLELHEVVYEKGWYPDVPPAWRCKGCDEIESHSFTCRTSLTILKALGVGEE